MITFTGVRDCISQSEFDVKNDLEGSNNKKGHNNAAFIKT